MFVIQQFFDIDRFRTECTSKDGVICKLTFLLTSNPLYTLMQKLLKSMFNCINPRYIQHLGQCLLRLSECLLLNLSYRELTIVGASDSQICITLSKCEQNLSLKMRILK